MASSRGLGVVGAHLHSLRWPFITLLTLLLLAPSARAGEMHEKFIELQASSPRESMITGLVMVEEQVDLVSIERRIADLQLSTRASRHQYVVETARALAQRTQAPLLAQLAEWQRTGRIESYRTYWVTNMISVTGLPEVFDELAPRADVGTIYMNEPAPIRIGEDGEETPDRQANSQNFQMLPNNLVCVNVQPAWNLGFEGQGRLVALFDSGADGTHPALAARWRGTVPGVDWWEAWRDPYTGTTFPYDARTHGTHVLGIMVGETPIGGAIGVAPGARWIAAGATIEFDSEKIIECYEWAVDPDGDPQTIDDVPDVINNSWGTTADCETTFWNAIDLVEAAGIVNTIAVDNRGPNAMSVNSPESRATSATVNWSVGNVNSTIAGYPIHTTSGRGPSPCDSVSIKPEVTAPGVAVNSTLPGGGYGTKTGASQACPHTSGAVAILRQVDPDLSVDDIKWILMSTAVDKGTAGEDNNYGWGILDVGAAVDSVLAQLPRNPPVNLAVTASQDTTFLSWERPDPIHQTNPLLRYRIYRAPVGDAYPPTPIAEPADTSASLQFVDTELAWDEYKYVVTAFYALEESAPSNEVTVGVFPNEPPTGLSNMVSVDTVTVEWLRPDPRHAENPVSAYRIYRAADSDPFPPSPIATFSDTSATVIYVDDPLPWGTYRYAVVAEYPWNESPLSQETIALIYPFDPPTGLAFAVDADSIALSWNRPDSVAVENPIQLYRVYRALLGNAFPDTALAEVVDPNTLVGFLDEGVPYDSYEYAVSALYQNTESDTSAHVQVPASSWMTTPFNLLATVSVDSIRLEWERPVPVHSGNPVLSYRVYRALVNDSFPVDPIAEFVDPLDTVSYLDLQVPPESYHYAVSAVYASGESGLSPDAPATVYPTDPPEDLTATPDGGHVGLQWNRPQTVDRDNPLLSFRIYRAPLAEPFPETPIAEIVDTTNTVAYVDSMIAFADLHWRVTAVYLTAESPPSNEAVVTELMWMNAPDNLSAAVASDSVSLSWNRPTPIHPDNALTLYRIYGAAVGQPFGAPIAEVTDALETVSYPDPDVPFEDRRYVVTALYLAAESDSSNEVQILEETWLSAPRSLARSVAADSVLLSWERPEPRHPDALPISFRVYRADVGQPFGAPLVEVPDSTLTPAWVDLAVPFGNHRYAVTTLYSQAESDSSDEVQVLESEWTTPPRTAIATVAVDSVTIEWSPPSPLHPSHLPTTYRIFRAPAGNPFPVDPLAVVPSATDPLTHLDLGVPPGDYAYAITALYPSIESDTSGHAAATVYARTPPGDLAASVAADSVHLTWSRPSPIDVENPLSSYRVYRALLEDSYSAIPLGEFSDTASVVAFVDPGVAFDDWKYRVTGVYANAESDPSGEIVVSESLWISPSSGLTAEVAADSVLLAWSSPAPTHPDQPPTLYRIFRAPIGQPFPGSPLAEVADSVTSFVDLAVPLADHVYTVTVLYASAESDTSNHAMVEASIWSGPAQALLAEVAVDTITLNWSLPDPLHPSNPPLVYRVFRAPQGQPFPGAPIGTVNGVDPLTYVDPALPVGDYTYAIQVVYAAAQSDTSNHADASVYPRQPPQALIATVAADSVRLTWSAPDVVHPNNPVLTYRVYRALWGEPFGVDPIGDIVDTSFVDLGVPFDSLHYAVTALYANTESVPSNLIEVLEEVWTSSATDLVASVVADSVHLSWNRPGPVHPTNDVVLYRVYRSAFADTFAAVPLAEVTDPLGLVNYLDPGVPYESLRYAVTVLYAVSAESDTSNHTLVLEEVWNLPPVALAQAVAADTVNLQWSRPGPVHPANPVQTYRVYRSHWNDPFGVPLVEVADPLELVLYSDPGVPLDSLRYAVTTLYAAGESDTSNHVLVDEEIWFTPPQSLTAFAHNDSVHLEWQRPGPIHASANDLQLYRVYRALDGQPYGAPLVEVADASQTVVHEDPTVPPGTYDYAVSALYLVRESGLSNQVEVMVANPSAVGDLFEPGVLSLRVAPNPFAGTTAIHFSPAGTAPLSVMIYDVSGARIRQLLETQGARVEERFVLWDGRDGNGNPVATGTYFVRLREGPKTITHRVVLLK